MVLHLDATVEDEDTELSTFEMSSVGRLYVSLSKIDKNTKWPKLLAEGQVKPPNMSTWWELVEKYQEEIEKMFPEDEEDEPLEEI